MSKRINVNPDHYKVAGREKPGNPIVMKPMKRVEEATSEEIRGRWARRKKVKGKS